MSIADGRQLGSVAATAGLVMEGDDEIVTGPGGGHVQQAEFFGLSSLLPGRQRPEPAVADPVDL